MTTLTPEAWAQVRAAYEAGETPVEDICVQYGISSTTLRHRMRRWGWTRRRPPVPREGPGAMPFSPPPVREAHLPLHPPLEGEGRQAASEARCEPGWGGAPSQEDHPTPLRLAHASRSDPPPPGEGKDEQAAVLAAPADLGAQLQSAVARVLPAIEAIIARLATGAGPREMEQAGRALSSLTRTLRELNALLAQHNAQAGTASRCAHCADMPEDMDAFREQLARRIRAFVASREGEDFGVAAAPPGEAKAAET